MSKKPSKSLAQELDRYITPFRHDGSGKFHLKSRKTNEKGDLDKEKGEEILDANKKRLVEFQEKLYAQDRWSVLLIFQGMDAAGKDSAIKAIFEGINPQGCEVTSFKAPSTKELDHDFLWRHDRAAGARPYRHLQPLPLRGMPGDAVHPEILAKEKLPQKLVTKNIWKERFEDICRVRALSRRNGTVVLKFFLNLSKEEQRARFLDRLEEPAKHWKFSMDDIKERALWPRYMAVYQDIVRHTATPHWRPGMSCRPTTNGSRAS